MIERKTAEVKRIEPQFSMGAQSAEKIVGATEKSPEDQVARPTPAHLNLQAPGTEQNQLLWGLVFSVLGFVLVASIYLFAQNRGLESELAQLKQLVLNTAEQSSDLSRQVSEAGQSLDQTEGNFSGELTSVKKNLDQLTTGATQLQSQLTQTQKRLDAQLVQLKTRFSGFEKDLQKDLGKQQERITAQSDALSGLKKIDQQLAPLAASISQFELRIAQLAEMKIQLDQLTVDMNEKLNWQESVTGLEAAFDSVDMFRQQTNQSLDRLERAVRQIDQDIKLLHP